MLIRELTDLVVRVNRHAVRSVRQPWSTVTPSPKCQRKKLPTRPNATSSRMGKGTRSQQFGVPTVSLHFLFLGLGGMRGWAAGTTFLKSLLLELVALLDDLGDPAGIPIDHRRIAFCLPSPLQAFIGPITRGFAVGRKGNLEGIALGVLSEPGTFKLACSGNGRRCEGKGKQSNDEKRRQLA
jgi:hypothetical protein